MSLSVPRVVIPAPGRVELETVEVADPGPGEIRARAAKTLISAGTERNVLEGDRGAAGARHTTEPLRPGYSWTGVVDAVGPGVEGFAVGDRVVTSLGHQGAGIVLLPTDYVVGVPFVAPIPDDVSDEAAAFVALSDVALHGVRRGAPSIGDPVAIFGEGVVGQLVTQFARMTGAYPVIAVDLVDERLEAARESGASHVVNAGREDAVEAIRAITEGEGARVVFMTAPAPALLPDCMRACAHGGTVAVTASHRGRVEITLQDDLLRREINVTGTYQAGYPRLPYHGFHWTRGENRRYALELMQRNELRVAHLISHRVPYDQAPAMYEMIARGPQGWLGIVLDWHGAPAAS